VKLGKDVDHLYTSLDIPQRFPTLQGANLDFVRTLLLARDLKINIRKRAIASFFEWERLDQAAGGRAQPLGLSFLTRLIQFKVSYLCYRDETPSTNMQCNIKAEACINGCHS